MVKSPPMYPDDDPRSYRLLDPHEPREITFVGATQKATKAVAKRVKQPGVVTIDHIRIACGHVVALTKAGVSRNLAIRTLELLVDVYANRFMGGRAGPHHVSKVKLWSIEAKRVLDENPGAKPKDHLRVEHGTPRRLLARRAMSLAEAGALDDASFQEIVTRDYKLAVITIEEDLRLNAIASQEFNSPDERWAAAEIKFPT